MYWGYAVTDISLTLLLMKKRYASNVHRLTRMIQLNVVGITARLVGGYAGIEYYSAIHLERRVLPILAK
jgi:hypothetical protein